ncbi:MAG TPA: hypothetical protein PKJ41_16410 [Bryobacteraceae bacterium]|nr:hypothetical protein [Bryobacteraceae bacterium]
MTRNWAAVFVLFLSYPGDALGQDDALEQLRTTLNSVKSRSKDAVATQGATPELTKAKHQLRDWVESYVAGLPGGGESALELSLNGKLATAGMTAPAAGAGSAADTVGETLAGFLGEVKIRHRNSLLAVTTGVGIVCGYDESIYVYRRANGKWKRIFDYEQTDYREGLYRPQQVIDILASPSDKGQPDLVLALGYTPWCTSNWRADYLRIWSIDAAAKRQTLVETNPGGFSPWFYLKGSIDRDQALVEAMTSSLDAAQLTRTVLHHYDFDDGKALRIDPVALRPADFADEWLGMVWEEAQRWSDPANPETLRTWHTKLRKERFSGEFIRPSKHCEGKPGLWAVGVDSDDGVANSKKTYFLVQWRPPFRFRMVQVSEQPPSGCTEPDPEGDQSVESLFQSWPGQ